MWIPVFRRWGKTILVLIDTLGSSVAWTQLMSCPFAGPKMFCVGPNFLSQAKNLTAFSAFAKTFVPAQKQFY